MLQKEKKKKKEKSRVCEYVSKRAASLVLSGFIVLEIVKSIRCCIKFEVSFAVNSYSYNSNFNNNNNNNNNNNKKSAKLQSGLIFSYVAICLYSHK